MITSYATHKERITKKRKREKKLIRECQQCHLAPLALAEGAGSVPEPARLHHLVHGSVRIRQVDDRDRAGAASAALGAGGLPAGRRQRPLRPEQGSRVFGEGQE